MTFLQRANVAPSRLGILPGTFNPVTVAHLAMAEAGLQTVDEVVFVLPKAFPHKPYTGASFEERVEMLRAVLPAESRFSIATTNGGLFREIADEFHAELGQATQLSFLCGRDAAERIAGWDYGDPDAFRTMLREFNLLVAARHGEYEVPHEFRGVIERIELCGPFDHVSSTEVRERIREGKPWQHLVPRQIHHRARKIYE